MWRHTVSITKVSYSWFKSDKQSKNLNSYKAIVIMLLILCLRCCLANEPMPMIFGSKDGATGDEVIYGIDKWTGGTVAVGCFTDPEIARD